MPRAAVFLDRDNTLIHNSGYLADPDAVRLLGGAADAVSRLRELGYVLVTVSNQSGVGRGLLTEDDVRAVNRQMDVLLRDGHPNALIDRHYFCPFHPEASVEKYRADSPLRKPRPGMLQAAARDLDLDLAASWLIGDAGRDIEAGRAAGCATILLRDLSVDASPHASDDGDPDHVVTSLADAAEVIADSVDAEDAVATASDAGELTSAVRELRADLRHRQHHDHHGEFSVASLLAGITQVLALAVLFLAFLWGEDPATRSHLLLTAIFVQLLTMTLAVMAKR